HHHLEGRAQRPPQYAVCERRQLLALVVPQDDAGNLRRRAAARRRGQRERSLGPLQGRPAPRGRRAEVTARGLNSTSIERRRAVSSPLGGGSRRIRRFAFLILPLLPIVVCAAAQREGAPPADDKYLGLWSGSWEGGGGSGGFDLTLERDKDKNLIGSVAVTGGRN